MIPNDLKKRFEGAVNQAIDKKRYLFYETKEEKLERIREQLGIPKHGKGNRKKKNKKKKGGKK